MRITTLAKNYFFYCVLVLALFGQNSIVYSQCPTVTNPTQSFCDTQTPTIASLLAVDNGGGIKWYADATGGSALSSSTVLVDGQDYFADDNTGSCGLRQGVVVTIYSAPTGANFQGVCVTSLSQATPLNPQFVISGNNLQWYTLPVGGTAISNSTILTDNTIYYISQTNPDTGCETSRFTLFVNVGLVPIPTGNAVQEFCNVSGILPTVADLVASGNNNWYLTPAFGIPLDLSTTLVNGQSYYATTVDPPCESSTRLEVLVNIYEPNDAGTDGAESICENQIASTAPFDLFDLLGGTPDNTGVWTGPVATSNGYQGTLDVASMNLAGSPYVFTYTVSSALCATDTSTVTITILPLPTVIVAVGPTTICSGDSATVTFTGTPNATVTYNIDGGSNLTIVLNNSGTASLTNTYSTDTTFNIISIASSSVPSCIVPQTTSVTITVLALPTATAAFNPVTICANTSSTLTFTGTPNATVTYNINGAANQTILLNASGTATLVGTYLVNTTVTLVSVTTAGTPSCTKLLGTTITLTVIDPTATAAFNPVTICANTSSTLTFTGTPNATVTYNINGAANQTILLNASGTATLVGTYLVNTTVTLVSVTTAGTPSCTKLLGTTITLTVIDPTATAAFNPVTICANTSSTLTFTGTPNATVTYNINGAANQTILLNASGTATLVGTYLVNTTVTLVSVTTAGTPSCTKLLGTTITLTVIDPTATAAFNPVTICANTSSTLTFTGTPNATVTYNINGAANQTILLNASGTATLVGTYLVNTTVTLVSVTTAGTPSCTKLLGTTITLTVIDPTATAAFNPVTICANTSSTLTFTGTPNATVTYNINGAANQTILLNASGTATLVGTYTVNTTVTLVSVTTAGTPSCTKLLGTTITLTVIDPTATAAFNPVTICANTSSTLTFTGTPNATVTYNINGAANQTILLNASGTATLVGTYTVNTTVTLVSVTTAGTPSCTKLLGTTITLTVIDPTATAAFNPVTICANTSSTLTFTGTPNATVTYNINGAANQTILLNASGTATLVGTYTVNTTVTLVSVTTAGTPSCTKLLGTTITLTVIDPTATAAFNPVTICANTSSTLTFTGTPNATVTYNINGAANQTILLNASGTATLVGTYTVNTTVTLVSVTTAGTPSCTKLLGTTITLTVIDPTATAAFNPVTICANTSSTLTFTGTPNATVTYNINGAANQTILLNASGTATLVGTYTVNTTVTLVSVTTAGTPSCTKLLGTTITLTVIDPTATAAFNPVTICANTSSTLTFTGTPNATVTYNINGAANQTILLNASGTATLVGTYTVNTTVTLVSVTTAGTPSCTKLLGTTITLTVIDPTATAAFNPVTICANTSSTLTFTGTPNATVTYNINGAANQTILLNASGTATLVGTYTVNTTVTLVSVSTSGSPNCVKILGTIVTLNIINPVVAAIFSPTTICANTSSTLTFTGTPNATVTYNINGAANQTILLNASGTATLVGTYTVITTVNIISVSTSGIPSCVNTQTSSVTLTVIPLPTVIVSASPPQICSGESSTVTFTGTPNATVTYNIDGGADQTVILDASGIATLSNTYSADTTINIISVVISGTPSCSNPQTSSITITVIQLPTVSISVLPTTICSGSNATATFTGTPNAIVTYNINGGANQTITLDAAGTGTLSNTYAANTTFTIVSVATSGMPSCVNSQTSSVTITIVQPPIAGTNTDLNICVLNPPVDLFLLLGPTAQVGGTWSPALASGTGIFNPAVDASGTYTYTIVGTVPCPSSSASVQVTVNPIPDAGNDNSLNICSNQNPIDLFNSLLGTPQTGGTWSPALASGTSIFNPAVDVSGVYTYTITGVAPCVNDVASITVNVIPGPEAGTNNSITLCVNSPTQDLFLLLGPSAQPGGVWSPAMASGTGVFNPAIDAQGDYTYTLSGSQPCDNDTAIISVTVNPVPNAGNDSSLILCSNSPSQDLFLLLGANAQTGGTWSPALASGTGVFDPSTDTAQTYVYSVGGGLCTSDTADVAVSIIQAPNAGGIGQTLNTCVSTTSVDLFTGLDGTQDVGTWNDDNTTGALTANIFNPSVIGVGTYNFTYTVLGTSPCANATSTVTVIVNPLPIAGNNNILTLCSNDSSQDLFGLLGSTAETGGTWSPTLASGTSVFNPAVDSSNTYTYTVTSPYCGSVSASVIVTVIPAPNAGGVGQTLNTCTNITSLDLATGLDGTQGVGTWNDDNATGALTGSIFNPSTVGVGTYTFTYTVLGISPCTNATSTVTVIVNPLPNAGTFSGIVSICPSTGVLDLNSLLTGEDATGVWTDSSAVVVTSPLTIISFAPATYSYTYTVTNSCGTDAEVVQFTVLPNPQISTLNVSTSPICIGSSAIVSLNGMVDGVYILSYDLTGSNTLSGQSVTVTIAAGIGSFTVPSASLPNVGTTVISFTNILNTVTNCTNTVVNVAKQIIVRPLADIDTTNLSAQAVCFGNNIIVAINSAANLPDGVYQFNYSIPGATPTTGNSGDVTITAGVGQFTVPASMFASAGSYTLTVIGIITTTGCTNANENATVNFIINPIPSLTDASVAVQDTCLNSASVVTISGASSLPDGVYSIAYQLSGANTATTTVSVTFTAGVGTFTIPATDLTNAGDTVLTINQLISTITTCGSTGVVFTPITFSVTSLGTPVLIQDGNLFCEDDNPTIASLSTNIVGFPTVIWYDAPTGGTAYSETDLLVNGTTYYAALVAASGCEGATRLAVTVDLTVCDDILIPDGFSPNNDGINDTFEIANLPILYPNFKLEIYNRYGNLIYTGNRNIPNWDGTATEGGVTLGNNLLPTGVYFYILNFNDGTRKAVQGRVYLNR